MSLLDRLLMRPERATGTRAQQTVERYRMAELRLERDTLAEALRSLTLALERTRGMTRPQEAEEVRRALTEAHRTNRWAVMREQAREISRENDLA